MFLHRQMSQIRSKIPPKLSQNCLKILWKWSQNRPKMVPKSSQNRPKIVPKWLRNRPPREIAMQTPISPLFWGVLGSSRDHLGRSWWHFGGKLGPSWDQVRAKLGQDGAKMGPRGAKMSQDGAKIGPTLAKLGPTWANLGPWSPLRASRFEKKKNNKKWRRAKKH